jgi:uncharacterized protein
VVSEQRLLLVDLLRGAALLGILAVNCWFFASSWLRLGAPEPDFSSGADAVAYALAVLLFATKSYLLFGFLFGVSFVLQQQAAQRDDADFAARMRRRLLGLMVLGLLHGLLLYPGDILLLYGLLGFFLLGMRRTAPTTLVRRAIVLTATAAVLLGLLGLLSWTAPADVAGQDADAIAAQVRSAPFDVLAANVADYGSALASVFFVQALPALAAMLVGMAAAQSGYIRDAARQARDWRRIRIIAPTVGLLGAVVLTAASLAQTAGPLLLGFAATTITAPFLTATYVALLTAWWRRSPTNRMLRGIAAAGRLTLTNYLGQSLLLAWLFTGYGLAWMDQVSAVQTLIIVAAIFSLQVVASAWWVRRHRYGPAEWVLRRWTYRAGS